MRIRYSLSGKGLPVLSKPIAVLAGLSLLTISMKLEKTADAQPLASLTAQRLVSSDPRTERLQKFFSRLHCPVSNLSEEFIHAADDNQLDWRLLPSISVVESGGGKAYRNNNIFGWANGTQLFPTIRAGINEVAFRLGKSALYRHRDVLGKLKVYNPDESYAASVLEVMNRISPTANLTPVRTVIQRQDEFVYVSD